MFCSSCSFWQSKNDKNKMQDSDSEIQTNIPFSTKEPEIFQAEIITATILNGKRNEQKYFLAKKGEKHLTAMNVGSSNETAILNLSENKSFVINHSAKTYRKSEPSSNSIESSSNQWKQFLVTKWLNEGAKSKFEKIGTENNLTKHLVKLDNSTNSEVTIFVDEKVPFPVKQEFYSITNGKKVLTMSVEVKNYKIVVDDKLFELPKDYKEIN
jgi:hypothetical protein